MTKKCTNVRVVRPQTSDREKKGLKSLQEAATDIGPKSGTTSGLPDFSRHIVPKRRKLYHVNTKLPNDLEYTIWPKYISNGHKIYLHFSSHIPKSLQKYPNWDLGFENIPYGNPAHHVLPQPRAEKTGQTASLSLGRIHASLRSVSNNKFCILAGSFIHESKVSYLGRHFRPQLIQCQESNFKPG
jgi:hypothetical protein